MSNFTAYGARSVQTTSYVGVEHGTKAITLSIDDGRDSVARELSPNEARELARTLVERAEELDTDPRESRYRRRLQATLGDSDRLDAIVEQLKAIVVVEGEDRGVVLLSQDAPTRIIRSGLVNGRPPLDGREVVAYELEHFSPLGEALIALYETATRKG